MNEKQKLNDTDQRAVNMLQALDGLNPSEASAVFAYALTLFVQINAQKGAKPKEYVRTFRNFITKILKSMEERI